MTKLIAENGSNGRQHRAWLPRLIEASTGPIRVVSPYVTDCHLLSPATTRNRRLLASISTMDIVCGATSLESIRALIDAGVECRNMDRGPRLHAKVYIFGSDVAVISSANLTTRAFDTNIEVGVEITGSEVAELQAWYDGLWREGTPITTQLLSSLKLKADGLRAEYKALTSKAEETLRDQGVRGARDVPRDDIASLFASAPRFFVCNTNRRNPETTSTGKPLIERRMYERKFAAAWTTFNYPQHMSAVCEGDAILMFAKGLGIIGIGRARGGAEILSKPADPDRLYREDSEEWRVPVDWIEWLDEDEAFPISDHVLHATFWDITAESYHELREGVRKHFMDR